MKFTLRLFMLTCCVLVYTFVNGQNLLSQQSLTDIKSDQVSDEQLLEFIQQAKGSGMNVDQVLDILKNKGMPVPEVATFRSRISALDKDPVNGPNVGISGQNAEAPAGVVPVSDISGKKKDEEKSILSKVSPGKTTAIYGHQFFKNNSFQTYEKGIDGKAPDNYIIGSGDEFAISVFGYSFYNDVLKVDANGFIKPNNIGPINVKGLTFAKSKELIRSKFASYFDLSNNQVSITLSYSRIITVNIVGEVEKPGSYKIPAMNTAFNALIAVGGPTEKGSVRNIQIRRKGKLIRTLDVYDFLANPDSKLDYFLEDNDYIVIPPAQKIVSISGEIRRPMKYELQAKENLNELMAFAGGLTSRAYTKLFLVTRLNDLGTQRQLLNYSLDSLTKNKINYKIKDEDFIEIYPKLDEISQIVEIQGPVLRPGVFELKEGERISDLIKKSDGLRKEAKLDKAFIIRTKDDFTKNFIAIDLSQFDNWKSGDSNNKMLEKGDVLRITSSAEFADRMSIDAVGLFRKPGTYEFHNAMTLGDLMFQAGGLKLESDVLRIEISRISFFDEGFKPGQEIRKLILTTQIGKDLKLSDDDMQFKLQPYDQVFVRMIPNFEYQKDITLNGELKYPGIYALISKEERIADLVARAGGLNQFAFAEGASLYRPSLPGNYIVMNLKEALKNPRSKYNYILKEGDVLNIPKVMDLIAIRGTVSYLEYIDQKQLNVPFIEGKRANYYVNQFALGFSDQSWRKKTYVVENSSKVSRTKNFLIFNLYPKVKKGSVVYIVSKEKKVKKQKQQPKEPVNWNKTIENLTVKITGLLTIYVLAKTLSK